MINPTPLSESMVVNSIADPKLRLKIIETSKFPYNYTRHLEVVQDYLSWPDWVQTNLESQGPNQKYRDLLLLSKI